MSLDLYIYYRVAVGNVEQMHRRVSTMQERLAAASGVTGRLRRRAGLQAGTQTWMEIYPAVPDGFAELLAREVKDASLPGLTEGERHTEQFEEFLPCA